MVGGKVLHVDGSLVAADASNESIVTGSEELIVALKGAYAVQDQKLETRYYKRANDRLMSLTDPDATVVSRVQPGLKGKPCLSYKHHRVVDDRNGVITAIETTAGDVEENRRLSSLVEQQGYKTHMGNLHSAPKVTRQDFFQPHHFHYDPEANVYRCPAGEMLYPRRHCPERLILEYCARKGTYAPPVR